MLMTWERGRFKQPRCSFYSQIVALCPMGTNFEFQKNKKGRRLDTGPTIVKWSSEIWMKITADVLRSFVYHSIELLLSKVYHVWPINPLNWFHYNDGNYNHVITYWPLWHVETHRRLDQRLGFYPFVRWRLLITTWQCVQYVLCLVMRALLSPAPLLGRLLVNKCGWV